MPAVEAKPAGLCQSEGLSVSVRVIASEGSSFFPLAPVNICRWHLVQSESSSAASLRLETLLATFKRLKSV